MSSLSCLLRLFSRISLRCAFHSLFFGLHRSYFFVLDGSSCHLALTVGYGIFDEYLWYLRHWARGREAVYNSLCYFQWAEICIWYRVYSNRICYYAWKYATRSMKLRPSSQWYWTLDCYRDQLSSDMDLCHSLNNKVHSCRFSTSLFAQSSGYFRNLFPKWTAWAA